MVVTCIAYGCTEWMGNDPSVSFHQFPHKNPERLRKWIQAIRRKDWVPTKNSYICSKHFTESSFVVRPGKQGRRLYEHAIPSVFPSFPEHLQKMHVRRKSPTKRKLLEEPTHPEGQPTHSQQSPSKIAKSIESDHSYADDSINALEQLEHLKELQKQVKVLKQKVSRRDEKIKNIEQLFTSLKEKNLILEEQHSLLQHNFGGIAENLFQNQLKNVKSTTPHRYRYSEEIKQFAMTLHYYSPKAYDFV